MNEYSIPSKTIIYSLITKKEVPYKREKEPCLIFDSKSEFKIYKLLTKLDIPLFTHVTVKHLKWNIDFVLRIDTKEQKQKIKPILDLGYRLHLDKFLYLEYKGIIDRKTIKRLGGLKPLKKKSLVIIYDKPTKDIKTISTDELRELIK